MLESILEAVAVVFVVAGPIDNSVVFASLAKDYTPQRRRKTAIKSCIIAVALLLVFALLGDDLLRVVGVQLASLEVAGGILLLLLAIQMVWGNEAQAEEEEASKASGDIAVFPMAMPLIAGPDAIVAVIVLMGKHDGHLAMECAVLGVIVGMLTLTLLAMLFAARISKLLGSSGLDIITRIHGVLLAALACEFILEGISHSSFIQDLLDKAPPA
jgi:multiple antibiotic resistance protein